MAERVEYFSKAQSSYVRVYPLLKRIVDLMGCVIALPIMLPLMAVIALAIRLDSPGPVLFIQERVGKHGRRFRIFKFRTMIHNRDDSAEIEFMKAFVAGRLRLDNDETTSYKAARPAHISRVGRILRRTSLDELPQLLNILRGEMSLVGPRPYVPWEVAQFRPEHYMRLEVLPGLTGLAQVRGRSNISFRKIIEYDIEYIRQQSLGLDLQIIWWTVFQVLTGRGAG